MLRMEWIHFVNNAKYAKVMTGKGAKFSNLAEWKGAPLRGTGSEASPGKVHELIG